MPDFVWIVPSERQSSLGDGGISPSYIIPAGQMNGHEGRLRGSRLWIILRGSDDRCIGTAFVKSVEQFYEGYYAGDFLVLCDTAASFRLSSSFEVARHQELSDLRSQGSGLCAASESAVGKLKDLVSRAMQVKLLAPSETALKRVKFDVLPKKGKGLARAALSQITQSLSLDQVWASGTGEKLGPFSNFASHLLTLHGYDSALATPFLKTSDPASLLTGRTENITASKPEISRKSVERSIDLDFTEIDPEKIYARKFVPSEGYLPDLEMALSKTEAAEKLHQEMLRDISSYLKEMGLSPHESSSIDLMMVLNEQTRIFEIKSSTLANIVTQAAKGAFQIACYVNSMTADYQSVSGAVILHKIEDTNLEEFVHHALSRLGVKCLTYDPRKNWPQRVAGLLS